jgi:1,4-alpha-glucan branching enzyme
MYGEKDELVIYELHVGTFNVKTEGQTGTFDSAMEKLPYLRDLGINAVELMPVAEFPGDFSWGYNPAIPSPLRAATGGRMDSSASSRRPTSTGSR